MWLSKPPSGIQLNRNHPLAQGLVGCWLFNEGAGLRANDLTGNNNTGVLTNFEPMSATSGWTGGNMGTALQFNGTNNYVNCGNNFNLNSVFGTNFFTILAIFNSKFQAQYQQIVGKGSSNFFSSTPAGFFMDIDGNTFDFIIGSGLDDGNVNFVQTTTSHNTHTHMVGTADKSVMRLYQNGVMVANTNITLNPPSNTNKLVIGQFPLGDRQFFGAISVIMLWNRALNSQEVQQLYAQPYAMFLNPSERIRKNYNNEILI